MTILKSSLAVLALIVPALQPSTFMHSVSTSTPLAPALHAAQESQEEHAMLIEYLEVVNSDVEATCSALAEAHGITFGEPVAVLGNARTAALKGGGTISVRAPMAEHDLPIVRPYMLVEDIEVAIAAAEEAGADFAMRATEIPGHGKFAIYFLAGTQFGLWERLSSTDASTEIDVQDAKESMAVSVQYLEVVTSDVKATCKALAKVHGVSFGEPVAVLGNARTAALKTGGRIGVRAPMADHDVPVVRPYVLVNDIEAAVLAAEEAGGEFAMKATQVPGQGKFAIYFLSGTQFGLWENPLK